MPVVDSATTTTTSNIIIDSSLTTTPDHDSHHPTTTTTTTTTTTIRVDPSIRQLAQKLQQRRSFRSSHFNSSQHHSTTGNSSSSTTFSHLLDPIVAPGFGTRRDCARLARELSSAAASSSIDVDTVQYLMERRGRGVVPTPAAAEGSSNKTAVWDDFMKEAGMTTTTASNAADAVVVTGKRGRGAVVVGSTTTTNANGTTSTASSSSSSSQQRTYDLEALQLPSVPKKNTKKTKLDTTTTTAGGGGLLVQTGTMDVSLIARKNDSRKMDWTDPYTLSVPTVLPIQQKTKIATVVTAGHACHMLALSTTGTVYGWGRNEQSQLGAQFGKNVYQPTLLLEEEHNDDENVIVQAAVGKAHTILLTARGQLMACGSNKSGQCAIHHSGTDVVGQFRSCVVSGGGASPVMRAVACGEDFSIALDTDGYMYSAGSSEYGQLGNGETGQYFVSANKLAFANAQSFTKRTTFCHAPNEKIYGSSDSNTKIVPLTEDIRIQQVVCGKHHSIALEANTMPNTTTEQQQPRVFTWGCGDYGVLGHGIQADEYYPRNVGALANLRYTTTLTSASEIRISAGQHCSLLQTSNGHVYYWGKHRSVGEATMRPSLIDALANNGHIVTHIGAGGQTVVCATQHGQTVAWGQGMYGELGFGMDKKSSSKPSFVEGLEGCHILSLACGYGTTLFVVRDDENDQKVTAPLPRLDASVLETLAAEAADDDEEETDQTKPKGRKGRPKK